MSSICDSDEIVVVDNNKIAEIGDHDSLMKNKGVYYELWNKQNRIDKNK